MRTREEEYEDSDSVIYEYEPDYECESILSEASYTGYQENPLMEVLSYCQAMYDAIQKLDKKFDLLHRKVSEMQHTRIKPLLLKPVIVRVALQNGHVQVNSKVKHAQENFQVESQQPVGRQSPPLPTIVSTHSLHSSYTATNGMPDLSPQSNLAPSIVESTVNFASSPVASPSIPAPSEPKRFCFIKEFVGDPARNVKVLGTHLMKARQKTKPKYAARHLVRVLFPKKTLLCSIMGVSARGRRTLDPNKIAAIREFLATNFPTYDLSEHGKDWKTCITNVNAMIRCLRSETKANSASLPKVLSTEFVLFSQINFLTSSWYKCCNWKFPGFCLCVAQKGPADCSTGSMWGILEYAFLCSASSCSYLNYNGDSGDNSQNSQKMTGSTTDTLQNSGLDKFPEALHTSSVKKPQSLEPTEPLGSPWRNVQLPFSVIYVAKGKTRPELSARYLIRHMFPEEVLVKSNVYGSLDRGMSPLDSNKINALRDFLQENFPSFDLSESGFDWKACVAAINSTIRSLRHELKKATTGI
ncbi:BEND2 protein, partial [Daphoenositta chrysoptera]|nr:BEND2 protein [Daphoenositta chrysoptera]